jgi:hypothetical protein
VAGEIGEGLRMRRVVPVKTLACNTLHALRR